MAYTEHVVANMEDTDIHQMAHCTLDGTTTSLTTEWIMGFAHFLMSRSIYKVRTILSLQDRKNPARIHGFLQHSVRRKDQFGIKMALKTSAYYGWQEVVHVPNQS